MRGNHNLHKVIIRKMRDWEKKMEEKKFRHVGKGISEKLNFII